MRRPRSALLVAILSVIVSVVAAATPTVAAPTTGLGWQVEPAPFRLTFQDGGRSLVAQAKGDTAGPAYNETEAIRAPQYHSRTGAKDVKVAIFHQVVELDQAKELTSITLPALTAPRPHLFAVSVEKPT
jgi:hypothetical protein